MNAIPATSCPGCNTAMARINGRSLARALEVTGEAHDGAIRVTEWASVCPSCDAKKLGSQTGHPWCPRLERVGPGADRGRKRVWSVARMEAPR
jgi:hypothetical protein